MSKIVLNQHELSKDLGEHFDFWITQLKSPLRNSRERKQYRVPALLHPDKYDFYRTQRMHFGQPSDESVERLKKSVSRICRGQQVVKNALRWENPHVGTGRTITDKIRGEHWQLVMAWSGLEMLIADLCNNVSMASIDKFIEKLVDFELSQSYEYFEWKYDGKLKIKRLSSDVSAFDITDFLDITNKETKSLFDNFFHQRQPLTKPFEGLAFAKSLRHMIVHGALSPTKTQDWGLRPIFQRLTLEIGYTTLKTIQTLNGISN